MIVLITDFGLEGPYIGQMLAAMVSLAPSEPVINLLADAPVHDPRATAYLLPAYTTHLPLGTVCVCVVDPAVGGDLHRPVAVECDGRWYVGPDNGLFELVRRRGDVVKNHDIIWRPPSLSSSFHGRDLYAPVGARLARGQRSIIQPTTTRFAADYPDDLPEVIYLDHFGNAMTGLRAAGVDHASTLRVGGHELFYAKTFAAAPPGQGFWYENANGLLEIAVNQQRADTTLGLSVGTPVEVIAAAA